MRIFHLLLATSLVLIMACRKSGIESTNNRIIGKWTYIAYNISIVAPGQWYPAIPPNQTIEFKPDGSFITAESILPGAKTFEVLDSSTLKIQPASTRDGYILLGYTIDTTAKELLMYPINIISIEGFGYKFSR